MMLKTSDQLIGMCMALIGKGSSLSSHEQLLVESVKAGSVSAIEKRTCEKLIKKGTDPLGEAFIAIRFAPERRKVGAVYTPPAIVRSMIRWLAHQASPARIIDPGAGSGRFVMAAGKAFPEAQLIAVELDPLAALILRANLAVSGLLDRATIIVGDYREIELEPCDGQTAFVGNPPYVRHHDIANEWKSWYSSNFKELGIKASALAGLHLHFFLKTRLLAAPGDIGAFITSSEWLDVNYGSSLRQLLVDGLGALSLHVLEPSIEAFPGTQTTAAITCFRVGAVPELIRVQAARTLQSLNALSRGTDVPRERLESERKWSIIIRPSQPSAGEIELGELFRVHRGQVTGANNIWIAGNQPVELPESVQFPTVTKARDLIEAGPMLEAPHSLRRVIDLPPDLSEFGPEEQEQIQAFLAWARAHGVDDGYIAKHRRAWWSVGLKAPAPILCTYMARRAPQFTLNICHARHINVAHGLYPRGDINQETLSKLVLWLNNNTKIGSGRTYAGGLTKFEPKEVERLRIPRLEALTE